MTDKLTVAGLEADVKRLEQELLDQRIAFDAERSELQGKLAKALYDAEQAQAKLPVVATPASDGLE